MANNFFYKGRRDANRKKYNPPSKGKNWRNTSLTGSIVGAILAPQAVVAGALLGGAIGSLFGDSDSQTKRKNSNRKAYHAGHKFKKKRFTPRQKVVVIYK